MTIYYFTATGNSLKVAKQLGTKLISIPKAIKSNDFKIEDDVVGIATPIFGFNMPRVVKRFIKEIKITASYVFLIGTYGNMYAGFGKTVKKYFKKWNVQLNYVNTIKMVDNYLGAFEVNDQINKIPQKNYDSTFELIENDIKNRKSFIVPYQPKTHLVGLMVALVPYSIFDEKAGSKNITIDAKCVNCETCTKVCPVDNIIIKNKIVSIGLHCEQCLACVHNCPVRAIHYKGEKSDARWRNPEITLSEIIQSNN
jgi:ferredoxin/protein involved in ribonucleotide reduction